MSRRGKNVLLGILALAFGGVCYTLFRKGSYVAGFVEGIFPLGWLRARPWIHSCGFLNYYFPDFLWAFALGCGFVAIHDPKGKGTVLCAAVAVLCGCGWEILQYLDIAGGTGDLLDVMMYFLAGLVIIIKERVK